MPNPKTKSLAGRALVTAALGAMLTLGAVGAAPPVSANKSVACSGAPTGAPGGFIVTSCRGPGYVNATYLCAGGLRTTTFVMRTSGSYSFKVCDVQPLVTDWTYRTM